MKQIYPDVPEIDWLAELAEEFDRTDLGYVYKYVLWLRRMNLSVPQSDEFLIAFGFVVKYRALIFGQKLEKRDEKTVAIAEKQYKKLRRGEKLT